MIALTNNWVGLDISDLVIRAVVVQRLGRRLHLTAFQEVLLPNGIVVDGQIRQPEALHGPLAQLLRHAKPNPIKSRRVVVGLPDRRTFLTLVQVESTTDPSLLATRVETALAEQIPFPREDIEIDWQTVSPANEGSLPIVVAAAPKSLVAQYHGVLQAAGLTPIRFETESLAITRAIYGSIIPPSPQMLVDIGGTRTTVVVTNHGAVQFASSIDFSGTQLTHLLAHDLHLSEDDAEKAKQLYGLTRTKGKGTVSRILQNALEPLAKQLTDRCNFYLNHFATAEPIRAIGLTGGGAQLVGLREHLTDRLNCSVAVADPLASIVNRAKLPNHRIASFTTAIGLARPL